MAGWPVIIPCIAYPLVAQSLSAPIASDAAHTEPAGRAALLEAVCGAQANENGCNACPSGTDFPNERLNVRGVVYGHFLSPVSNDAAIGFSGCESHASGLGGALLLSRQNGAWKLESIRPAAIVEDCKKLAARDGHDVLICFGQDTHQGVADSFLYLLDFTHRSKAEDGLAIFFMTLDSVGACAIVSEPQEGLVAGTIERVSFAPAGRIIVETSGGSITSAEFEPIRKHCLAGEPTPNPLGLRLAMTPRTYTFFFNGTSVTPAPGNPPMLGVEAIAPESRALLRGVYTAPDGSFVIPVPYTFQTLRKPSGASSPVCAASALVCLLDPRGGKTQAAVEISRVPATGQSSCLNPEHLPGRSSHFVPGTYGYRSALGGGAARYEFWTGFTGQYQLDQSVTRLWHSGVCYQVAANIAHEQNGEKNTDAIGRDLMRIVNEFHFVKPRY